jgi:hypothetical protein
MTVREVAGYLRGVYHNDLPALRTRRAAAHPRAQRHQDGSIGRRRIRIARLSQPCPQPAAASRPHAVNSLDKVVQAIPLMLHVMPCTGPC